MGTTWIKNAGWVIAWDPIDATHYYLRDADVVFDEDQIIHVGPGWEAPEGPLPTVVDGRDKMVMPGLVNIHSHPTGEPLLRGLTEERKSRQFYMSTLYEYIMLVGRSNYTMTLEEAEKLGIDPAMHHDDAARTASARLAIYEMLKSGVTTFVDYSPMRPGWIDEVKETGIRTVVAPSFRSAYWYTPNGHEVLYEWDEPAGERAMQEAFDLLDDVKKDKSGLVSGMVAPGQIDTCTAELLKTARDETLRRKLPMQIHAAQSVVEFREVFRRHGKTPIQWLEELGVLGPQMVVGHCIMCDHHSWLHWPDRDDVGRMAKSGTSVAHCPNQFARGGVTLENFGSYRAAGINIGIGTDTNPHNFIDEMRWANMLAKVSARDVEAATTATVFHSGTIGGANALHDHRIGRLAPGAKPDVVLVDTTHPYLQPARDPLRTMMFCALERAITDVYVAGRHIVSGGDVTTIDLEPEMKILNEGQKRALAVVKDKDWAGRAGDEAFPHSIPIRDSAPGTLTAGKDATATA